MRFPQSGHSKQQDPFLVCIGPVVGGGIEARVHSGSPFTVFGQSRSMLRFIETAQSTVRHLLYREDARVSRKKSSFLRSWGRLPHGAQVDPIAQNDERRAQYDQSIQCFAIKQHSNRGYQR